MNEMEKSRNTDIMDNYYKSDDIVNDIQEIIEASQQSAYRAVDTTFSWGVPPLQARRALSGG